jgi:GNAT superfamily N-acetyltransferase
MSIAIAEVSAADEEDWRRLWLGWQAHMAASVPDHVTDKAWRLLIDPASGLHALIARNAPGEAIGFAHLSSTPFAWTASPILLLQDFFIAQGERGKGVGETLLKAVYAFGDRVGAAQVVWMVDERDERLQAFYSRHAVRTPYLRYMRQPWPW